MKKTLLLFLTFIAFKSFSQCTTCTYIYSGTGSTNFNVNSGETLCVNSNLTNPNINGGNGTICVATGVSFTWDNMSANQGWTINNYGTTNTSMTGGQGTFIVNNKNGGTFNFTSTNQISFAQNGGQTTQFNNEAGGTINAVSTSLFMIQSGPTINNSGNIYFNKFENAEATLNNNAYVNVTTEYYNHGGLTNNGLIEVNSLRVTDKNLPMVNGASGDIIVQNGASIGGNMTNNGTMEIKGGDLTISKNISGTDGWIRVENGVSNIQCGGSFFGTNLKFCDVNTSGNNPDAQCANAGTYNATVNCSYSTAGTPFPVKISSFESNTRKNAIYINWNASEANNFDFFRIQKSQDAKSFESIGKLEYNNESTVYSFVDEKPFEGLNYYRLQLNDLDGTVKYSKIISENFSFDGEFFDIENPVKGNRIHIFSNIRDSKIDLLDLNGRSIPYSVTNLSDGEAYITPGKKTPGMLIVKAKGKYQVFTKKIIQNTD
ncbi:MAG: hypothetical protein IPQ23_03395 [Cytophagaceae bacterium]|nr:hypothetical protein [Cytophagaceae bacterium]